MKTTQHKSKLVNDQWGISSLLLLVNAKFSESSKILASEHRKLHCMLIKCGSQVVRACISQSSGQPIKTVTYCCDGSSETVASSQLNARQF